MGERWKNARKDIPNLVKTENVVAVELGKTSDSGVWVVSIYDPDGKRTSFWLDSGSESGGNVTSVTPYYDNRRLRLRKEVANETSKGSTADVGGTGDAYSTEHGKEAHNRQPTSTDSGAM